MTAVVRVNRNMTAVVVLLLALLPGARTLSLPTATRRGFGVACTGAVLGAVLPASASSDVKKGLRQAVAARQAAEATAAAPSTTLLTARAQVDDLVKNLETSQDWVKVRRTLATKPGLGGLREASKQLAAERPARAEAILAARKAVLEAIFDVDKVAYERQMREITSYEVGAPAPGRRASRLTQRPRPSSPKTPSSDAADRHLTRSSPQVGTDKKYYDVSAQIASLKGMASAIDKMVK